MRFGLFLFVLKGVGLVVQWMYEIGWMMCFYNDSNFTMWYERRKACRKQAP